MNLFELDRLRQEGKCVNLSGNRGALDVATGQAFNRADLEIDLFLIRKRQERDLDIIERQKELELG